MPVNWRTAPAEQLIGVRIPTDTKYGKVRFGPFGLPFYQAVVKDLVPWPAGLLEQHPGWEQMPALGHPLTLSLLGTFADAVVEEEGAHRGPIRTNGFYRPLGTTWGNDPRGVIDTTDSIIPYRQAVISERMPAPAARLAWGLGHYRGISVDVAAGQTAKNFGVTRELVIDTFLAVGFARPFLNAGAPRYTDNAEYGEYWHWRPDAEKRKQWASRSS